MSQAPDIEIVTQNEKTVQFNMPDGELMRSVRVRGRDIKDMAAILRGQENHTRYWIALGTFLVMASITLIWVVSWNNLRLASLPQSKEEVRELAATVIADALPKPDLPLYRGGDLLKVLSDFGDTAIVVSGFWSGVGWDYKLQIGDTTIQRTEFDLSMGQR